MTHKGVSWSTNVGGDSPWQPANFNNLTMPNFDKWITDIGQSKLVKKPHSGQEQVILRQVQILHIKILYTQIDVDRSTK